MASVHTVDGGEAWAVAEGVLKQLRDGQWTVRATPRPGEEMRSAIPIGPGRVVVLFASRVAAFDPARSTWTTLIDAETGGLGASHDDARLRRRAVDRRRPRPRPPRRPISQCTGRPARPTA
jgi:hypothetical protein